MRRALLNKLFSDSSVLWIEYAGAHSVICKVPKLKEKQLKSYTALNIIPKHVPHNHDEIVFDVVPCTYNNEHYAYVVIMQKDIYQTIEMTSKHAQLPCSSGAVIISYMDKHHLLECQVQIQGKTFSCRVDELGEIEFHETQDADYSNNINIEQVLRELHFRKVKNSFLFSAREKIIYKKTLIHSGRKFFLLCLCIAILVTGFYFRLPIVLSTFQERGAIEEIQNEYSRQQVDFQKIRQQRELLEEASFPSALEYLSVISNAIVGKGIISQYHFAEHSFSVLIQHGSASPILELLQNTEQLRQVAIVGQIEVEISGKESFRIQGEFVK